jgi:hypothetical protein
MERLRKPTKNLDRDNRCPTRDSNRGHLECESRELLLCQSSRYLSMLFLLLLNPHAMVSCSRIWDRVVVKLTHVVCSEPKFIYSTGHVATI